MNELELYARWAPDDGAWTPWVKPVLFAVPHTLADEEREAWRAAAERARGRWTPPRAGDTALVLDLSGPDALALAVECAAHAYRPVPLFNSCLGRNAVVPNEPLRAGLELGVGALAAARLHRDAAPAFVLDSRRSQGGAKPLMFDNRWRVFAQDFPSANVLLARSIRTVVLVQAGASTPSTDLAHVLLRWQTAGLAIHAIDLAATPPALVPIRVAKPAWYGALFQRLLVTLGLRRNAAGGFGEVVPDATTTGTGFA
ncbi:MAG: hypothetical protein HZA52_13700 [Planctomycetes bacterium]|nr:hypothetical protein [Planctomycetota bacterium]